MPSCRILFFIIASILAGLLISACSSPSPTAPASLDTPTPLFIQQPVTGVASPTPAGPVDTPASTPAAAPTSSIGGAAGAAIPGAATPGGQPAQPSAPPSLGPTPPPSSRIALPGGQAVDRPTLVVDGDQVDRLRELGSWRSGGKITCLMFSPDGGALLVGLYNSGEANGIYRLRLAENSQPELLVPASAVVNSLAISADGQRLAYGTQEGELGLFDLIQGRLDQRIIEPAATNPAITAVAFHPSKNILAYATHNRYVDTIDLDTGKAFTYDDNLRFGTTSDLAFSPDGQHLAGGRDDDSVFLYDLAGGPTWSLPMNEKVPAVAFASSGELLGTGANGHVRVWRLPNKAIFSRQLGAFLRGGAFAKGGDLMIFIDQAGGLRFASAAKTVAGYKKLGDSPLVAMDISQDGTLLAVSDASGQLRLRGVVPLYTPTKPASSGP